MTPEERDHILRKAKAMLNGLQFAIEELESGDQMLSEVGVSQFWFVMTEAKGVVMMLQEIGRR